MDLWLTDPVTQAYLTCLKTSAEVVELKIDNGDYIDASNNDLSMNQIHSAMGWKKAINAMSNFENILKTAKMVEVAKDEG